MRRESSVGNKPNYITSNTVEVIDQVEDAETENVKEQDKEEIKSPTSMEKLEEGEVLDAKELIKKEQEETQCIVNDVAHLGPGSSFGEMALILSKPRMSSVTCLTQCHLIVLNKVDYQKSLVEIDRKHISEKVNFIKTLPVFSKLTRTFLSKFTLLIKPQKVNNHHLLYKQDDPADRVYIVKSGLFEISCKLKVPKDDTKQKEERIYE